MIRCIVAYSGVDFIFSLPIVTLPAGTTEACTNIQIINDETVLEGNETFGVEITPLIPVPVNISTAVVTIIDDDR